MIRRAFAVDPGPTRSGAALVDLRDDGWLEFVWGGHVENHGAELHQQMRAAARAGAVIAIEHLRGFAYEAKRVAQLLETAQAEGEIRGRADQNWIEASADIAEVRALIAAGELRPPQSIEAVDWRGELCRSKTASDEQIRIVVEGLCKVRPALKHDARPHAYDAAGLAIVALARANGRRIELPASVSSALALQQIQEKADRETKKRAKALGIEVPRERRRPTRAQTKRRSDAAKKAHAERRAR
jgi:hypothetical protein